MALSLLAVTPPAMADASRPRMRQALYSRLESLSTGEPQRMVRVLIRLRPGAAHGRASAVAGAPLAPSSTNFTPTEDPTTEALETRRTQVQTWGRAVLPSLTSPVGGSDVALAPTMATPSTVLDDLWAAGCLHVQVPASSLGDLVGQPDVEGVFEDVALRATPPSQGETRVMPMAQAMSAWGVVRIGALQARARHNVDGTGVLIGQIDSGVDPTHPLLAGRVAAFKDFVAGRTSAYDDDGHGTHTAGTMVGAQGIGVAPGARLIVAKTLDQNGNGSLVNLMRSMQWMLDPDGNPSTNDRPSVVNNSWGVDVVEARNAGYEATLFWELVRSWRGAGIVPLFSSGNEGAGKMLVPGGYPVNLSVGATDGADQIAGFSSSGRMDWQGYAFFKPDLVAPGVDVPSCYPGNRMATMSGTSQACPHVAGLIALTVQMNPKIPVRDREAILLDSVLDLAPKGRGQRSGEGRIDAGRALDMTRSWKPATTASTDFAPVYMRARRFKVSGR